MTPARQPHPQRCETCKNQEWTGRDLSIPDCKKCDHTPTSGERRFVEQMGCATHTSPPAPAAVWTDDDVMRVSAEAAKQAAKAAREQVLKEIKEYLCSCVWSDAPDCPGATDGEIICDGCERFEYPFPEDAREYVKSLRAPQEPQQQEPQQEAA